MWTIACWLPSASFPGQCQTPGVLGEAILWVPSLSHTKRPLNPCRALALAIILRESGNAGGGKGSELSKGFLITIIASPCSLGLRLCSLGLSCLQTVSRRMTSVNYCKATSLSWCEGNTSLSSFPIMPCHSKGRGVHQDLPVHPVSMWGLGFLVNTSQFLETTVFSGI